MSVAMETNIALVLSPREVAVLERVTTAERLADIEKADLKSGITIMLRMFIMVSMAADDGTIPNRDFVSALRVVLDALTDLTNELRTRTDYDATIVRDMWQHSLYMTATGGKRHPRCDSDMHHHKKG